MALLTGTVSAILARMGMLHPIFLITGFLFALFLARQGGAWLLLTAAIPTLFGIPAVPEGLGISELQVLLFLSAFSMMALLEAYRLRAPTHIPTWSITTLFALLLAASLMVARLRGVAVNDWLRGIMPFTLLWLMLPVALALQTNIRSRAIWMAASLGVLALLINLDVNFTFFSEGLYTCYWQEPDTLAVIKAPGCNAAPQGLIGPLRGRVTMYLASTTSEMVPLGCVLFTLLSAFTPSRILRNGLRLCALIALAAVVESLTRSMFAAMMLGLAASSLLVAICFRRHLRTFMVSLLILAVGGIFMIKAFNLESFWMSRFQKVSATLISTTAPKDDNISIRLEEYRIAMNGLKNHPFTGTGIGSRHTIRLGDTSGHFSLQSVGYIHNWVMYWLMVGGIPGFLLYASLFLWPLWVFWKQRAKLPLLSAAAAVTLLTIGAYGLFFAVFRLAGWNLLLALLAGTALRLQATSSVSAMPSSSTRSELRDCSSAPNCSS